MASFLSKLVDIPFRYLEWDENEKSLRDEGSGDGLTVLKIENSFRYCHSLGNYERNDNKRGRKRRIFERAMEQGDTTTDQAY